MSFDPARITGTVTLNLIDLYRDAITQYQYAEDRRGTESYARERGKASALLIQFCDLANVEIMDIFDFLNPDDDAPESPCMCTPGFWCCRENCVNNPPNSAAQNAVRS